MRLTIPAAVDRAGGLFGGNTAIAEPAGPRISYSELLERVRGIAGAFIEQGIEPGDRVAVWSPNSYHWVLGALGALYAGATLVPVNTRFTGPEALDVMGRSGARALLVAGRFLGTDRLAALRGAAAQEAAGAAGLGRLKLIVRVPIEGGDGAPPALAGVTALDWAEFEQAAIGQGSAELAALAAERAAAVQPDDVSDILFTSGTTGRSKGAMSAHAQTLSHALAWAECGAVTAADRYLVLNPFFHSFGYKAGILVCLLTGATIVPQLVYDPEQAMRLIEAERITVLPGAPTIYQTILDHPARASLDLSSLRLAVTGAAVVPVALVERMQSELSFDTVLTAYGLTEAPVVTMCRPGDDPKVVATTSGRAATGFEVKVAGADQTGQGEILVRGPNVMLGYLDDQAATREAIDADGWLHTGDVGMLDGSGNLTITDRLKDMYICGGFNVYPAEVEQALARLEGVADCAVIGVPDERLGEVGKAFIVTRPGHELTAGQVIGFCRERLANFKVPRKVEFRAGLPRNASGKQLKRQLREESR
ncbi:MAG TPA: FadD3 family acyl-CoA ligase [Streptosporangiaceae bacterium]|nr:FadD3 family acyl-CoA ligase [Streptosporangiaceae bacterium]